MKFSIPGLLGAIGELPSVINKGLLGPLNVNPSLGLDPMQVDQARQTALNDMAYGMMAAPRSNPMAGMAFARGNARENFSGRMVDILREQEIERMKQQRAAGDAYIQTLPEGIRGAAQVAGAQPVAQAQIAAALSPQEQPWRVLTPEEEAAVPGLDPSLIYKTNGQDIEVLGGRPPAPTIGNISVGGAGPPGLPDWAKKRQEQIATQVTDFETKADTARANIQRIDGMIEKSKKAKLSGMMAPGVLGTAEFLRSLGLEVAPEAMSDARVLQSSINENHMKWVQSLGGARGMTDSENKKLENMFTKIQDSPEQRVNILMALREGDAKTYEQAQASIKRKERQLIDLSEGKMGTTDLDPLPAAPTNVSQYPQAVNPKTKEVLIFKDGKWQKP
jgi:hypothetical protein